MKAIINHLKAKQKKYVAFALVLLIIYICYNNVTHDVGIFYNPLLITGLLAYVAVILLLDNVKNKAILTIDRLTNSGVFVLSSAEKKRFLKILSIGKRKWSIISALFFSLSILTSFLYAYYANPIHKLPIVLTIFEVVLAFISGIYFGEIMIYGQLGDLVKKHVKVQLILDHPDRAMGLSPIGKFYTYLITTISIPILFTSIWAFLIPYFPDYSHWTKPYLGLLVVALLYLFFIVIKPIFAFHQLMLTNHKLKLKEIDQISLRLIKLEQYENDFIIEESGENIELIKRKLKDKYVTISKAPLWPFKMAFFSFFFSSVVINLISLFGGIITILLSIKDVVNR